MLGIFFKMKMKNGDTGFDNQSNVKFFVCLGDQ